MIARRSEERAITLVEMVVATGLVVILLALALDMVSDANDVWRDQRARAEASRSGWRLVQKIVSDLRMAMPPGELGEGAGFAVENGQSTLLDALPEEDWPEEVREALAGVTVHADSICFPTARIPTAAGPEVPGMVKYALMIDENGKVLGAKYRTAPQGTPLDEGTESAINSLTRSLDFKYLGEEGRWRDEWKEPSSLPRAVRVSLANEGPSVGGEPRLVGFSTTVYLPTGTRIGK